MTVPALPQTDWECRRRSPARGGSTDSMEEETKASERRGKPADTHANHTPRRDKTHQYHVTYPGHFKKVSPVSVCLNLASLPRPCVRLWGRDGAWHLAQAGLQPICRSACTVDTTNTSRCPSLLTYPSYTSILAGRKRRSACGYREAYAPGSSGASHGRLRFPLR